MFKLNTNNILIPGFSSYNNNTSKNTSRAHTSSESEERVIMPVLVFLEM